MRLSFLSFNCVIIGEVAHEFCYFFYFYNRDPDKHRFPS